MGSRRQILYQGSICSLLTGFAFTLTYSKNFFLKRFLERSLVVQEEGKNNGEKEMIGKENEGACRGFPMTQADHAKPLMSYQVSTRVRCKAHYPRCPLGGLDCEQ